MLYFPKKVLYFYNFALYFAVFLGKIGVRGLEFNYLDSFTFYSVFKISASLAPGGWGRWMGGV